MNPFKSLRHALLVGIMLSSCSEPCEDCNEPSYVQNQIQSLVQKRWVTTQVTLDGEEITTEFTDFTLVLHGTINEEKTNVQNGTFNSENGHSILPQTGQWMFQPDNISSQLLIADRITDYVLVGVSSLQLSFFYQSQSNSRSTGLTGEYVFTLEAD